MTYWRIGLVSQAGRLGGRDRLRGFKGFEGSQDGADVVVLREPISGWFARLEEQFSRSPAGLEAELELAGRWVRFSAQDAELGQALLRPFGHLVGEAGADRCLDLEIEILSEPLREQLDSVYFELSSDGRQALQVLPRSCSLWRSQPAKIVACFQPAPALSLYELGRPLHAMLSLWFNQIGAPLVHAGLVELGGRGVLVGGQAGAGKTTTCLACLEAGQGFLGDDLVSLDANLRGHSLYATTFLTPPRRQAVAFLGSDRLEPRYPWEEKSLTYLWPGQQWGLRRSLEVAAVVLPGDSMAAARLSPAQALLQLAPSSLMVGGLSAGQAGLDLLASLVGRRPCYGLPWGEGVCSRLQQLLQPRVELA